MWWSESQTSQSDAFFEDLVGEHRRHHGFEPYETSAEERPSYLVRHRFLGNTVEVNPRLAQRLTAAERTIRAAFDALGPDHASRVHYGGRPKTFPEWAGIWSARGWRSSRGKHGSGSAVDLNYALQPDVVMRTGSTLGGEAAGASLTAQRRNAAAVYDRAVRFTSMSGNAMSLVAPMHVRRSGESTSDAWRRLYGVSQSLNRYFRYAFKEDHSRVDRRPIRNIESESDAQLLEAIPTSERQDETTAIGNNPAARPPRTRNPARGFLHMRRQVVAALADVGRLRWGAIDFGARASGDVHHFDLGNHAGYTPS